MPWGAWSRTSCLSLSLYIYIHYFFLYQIRERTFEDCQLVCNISFQSSEHSTRCCLGANPWHQRKANVSRPRRELANDLLRAGLCKSQLSRLDAFLSFIDGNVRQGQGTWRSCNSELVYFWRVLYSARVWLPDLYCTTKALHCLRHCCVKLWSVLWIAQCCDGWLMTVICRNPSY